MALTSNWQTAMPPCDGECAEARLNEDGDVELRSTLHRDRPATVLDRAEWAALLHGVRTTGRFDLA
jgi:uncharacterized protein DUF397